MKAMKKGFLVGLGTLFLHPLFAAAETPVAMPGPVPVQVPDKSGSMMHQNGDGSWSNGNGNDSDSQNWSDSLDQSNQSNQSSQGRQRRMWASCDYLMWWTKNIPVNCPLLTESTSPLLPGEGLVGASDTSVVLGGQPYSLQQRSGARFTVGSALDSNGMWGMECVYLFIAPSSSNQSVGSNGSSGSNGLFIPYNAVNPAPGAFNGTTAYAVAGPGFIGGAYLNLTNQLQSGECNTLLQIINTPALSVAGLLGCRCVYFDEKMTFGQGSQGAAGSGFDGQYVSTVDRFAASNTFYGCNVGMKGEMNMGGVFFNATGKVAVGAINQSVNVTGAGVNILPGVPTIAEQSGFFALNSNSGKHTSTGFGVIPELNCNLGYQVTSSIRAYVGYTFLYLDNVARPGINVDPTINVVQSPALGGTGTNTASPPVPHFTLNRTDFWAQGINFGFKIGF